MVLVACCRHPFAIFVVYAEIEFRSVVGRFAAVEAYSARTYRRVAGRLEVIGAFAGFTASHANGVEKFSKLSVGHFILAHIKVLEMVTS